MGKPFQIDRSFALTALTVLGMFLAILALWPLQGATAASFSLAGLLLVLSEELRLERGGSCQRKPAVSG